MELRIDTAMNPLEKVLNCKLWLLRNTFKALDHFVLWSDSKVNNNYHASRMNILLIHRCTASPIIHQTPWWSFAMNILNQTSLGLTTIVHFMQSTNIAWLYATISKSGLRFKTDHIYNQNGKVVPFFVKLRRQNVHGQILEDVYAHTPCKDMMNYCLLHHPAC